MACVLSASITGWNVHANGCLSIYWAFVLADAAADAALTHDMRALDRRHAAVLARDRGFFQFNGLVGQRAHLFTHDAIAPVSPSDAAILIDV